MGAIETNARAATLSALSPKSLTQRALKASEEVGELAEAVLGITSDLYKEKTENDVLLEVADVIICALSCAHKLGFSTEDVDRALNKKMDRWEGILKSTL